mmetsp:Transcript_65466/g.58747  ORF Transcript_65466/g.58747 Transcript_65466/m.58747 type:complete len:824 (+) Transcript_65466:151-2622(+)
MIKLTSILSLLLIKSTESSSDCQLGPHHISATLSGDPHFRTWNDAHQHFQGAVDKNGIGPDGRGYDVQYYLMTPCHDVPREEMPFDLIGSFAQFGHGPMSLENYIVLVLHEPDEIYYVFLSGGVTNSLGVPPLRRVYRKSDGASTYHRENTQNPNLDIHKVIKIGGVTEIGNKFTLNVVGNDQQLTVTLTYNNGCQLQFYNALEGALDANGYRWHWLDIQPPQCYFCETCGLLSDFQEEPGQPTLLDCQGQRITYDAPWLPQQNIPNNNYAPNGWTYEKEYHDNHCGEPPQLGPEVEQVECPADKQQQVFLQCQNAIDELEVCCRNMGGGICTQMLMDCSIDACMMSEYGPMGSDELIQGLLVDPIRSRCNDVGAFGPVPKLLYDFQEDAQYRDSMSMDPKYDLIPGPMVDGKANNAHIVNGVLRCDGEGDYLYSQNKFDFEVGDHTLEVLISLSSLSVVGGGSIAIDSNYDANAELGSKFDSIVYNEDRDQRWFLGSEWFRRTQKGAGAPEIATEFHDYIHLVGVYDVTGNNARLYRNGVVLQDYEPSGFMTAAANQGVRMMFCQRHYRAGSSDFHGRIRYGAYYDRALAEDEVRQLYETGLVVVHQTQFEVIGDELKPGQYLTSGQALRSPNGKFVAAMQEDGNFVVYDLTNGAATAPATFHTNTYRNGMPEYFLILQPTDGNLCIYSAAGTQFQWCSRRHYDVITSQQPPLYLIMQDDGNLVAYTKDEKGLIAYWDSKGYTTNGRLRAGKTDYFDFDSFIGNTPESTTSYMSYLLYLVGFLLITNIVCLTVYCLRKKENKRTRYKVVSIDSSDAEEVNLK